MKMRSSHRVVIRMSQREQAEWAAMLGPTTEARFAVIRDLLAHRRGDEMGAEDEAICRVQLARLRSEMAPHPDGWSNRE